MLRRLERFINKHIKHPRDTHGDYGVRYLLHIPAGFLVGLLPPPLDHNAVKIFLRYEQNEDKWTQDEAWKDVGGFMTGYVIGRYVQLTVWVLLAIFIIQRFI